MDMGLTNWQGVPIIHHEFDLMFHEKIQNPNSFILQNRQQSKKRKMGSHLDLSSTYGLERILLETDPEHVRIKKIQIYGHLVFTASSVTLSFT